MIFTTDVLPINLKYTDTNNVVHPNPFGEWVGGVTGCLRQALTLVSPAESVVTPSQPNQVTCYETYRFADPLQAAAPVFVRVGFGSGSDTNYPRITVQVGSAAASDGTLTGLVTPVSTLPLTYSGLPYRKDPYRCYCLLTPERFGLVFYPSGSSARSQCWIERWRRSGQLTLAGVTFLASGGGNTFVLSSSIDYQAQTVASRTSTCAAAFQPIGATTGLSGSSLILYPVRTWDGRREVGPLLSVLAYFQGDVVEGTLLSVLCWDGVRRIYKAQGVPWSDLLLREPTQTRQCCLALLWEGSATSALECEAPASPYFDVPAVPTNGRIWPRRTR